MTQKIKKYRIQILVVLLILIVQCFFASQKEGYHMDELISYEMANAEYNPWIVPIQPVGRLAKFMHQEIDADTFGEKIGNIVDTVTDVLKNRGSSKMLSYKADVYEEPVWITREQFVDYVTTDGTDNFNYLSVYFNVKDDNHPPIHFMLLHTISSLMSGRITPFMGCFINILMILGCVIIFMKLGILFDSHKITKNDLGTRLGIVAALLYGCSHASIATMLLIRMYGVLTFLCLLTFYIHMQKWMNKEFDKKWFGLLMVTVMGFWTQYFFLFYCICLSAVVTIGLLKQKRKRETFVYIRTMVLAAIVGVVIFPFAISDVFSSTRGVEALENLRGGFADYLDRLLRYGELLLSRCFGDWRIGILLVIITLALAVVLFVKKKEYRMIIVFAYVPVLGYFLLAAKMSPIFVDRYVMAAFPFVISWLALAICMLLTVKNKMYQIVCTIVLLSYCVLQVCTYNGEYLYEGYQEQVQISEEYEAEACICLYEGSGYYENLIEFANYEKTLLVTPKEMLEREDVASINQLQEVMFLVKGIVSEESLQEILEQYGFEVKEVMISEGVHGDRVYLCEKVEE